MKKTATNWSWEDEELMYEMNQVTVRITITQPYSRIWIMGPFSDAERQNARKGELLCFGKSWMLSRECWRLLLELGSLSWSFKFSNVNYGPWLGSRVTQKLGYWSAKLSSTNRTRFIGGALSCSQYLQLLLSLLGVWVCRFRFCGMWYGQFGPQITGPEDAGNRTKHWMLHFFWRTHQLLF